MNTAIRCFALIAGAAAGSLAATLPATAQPPPHPVRLRGSSTPSPTRSTAAAACPDTMRAVAQTNALAPFGAQPAQPLVVVPTNAFGSGQFGAQVRDATSRAQLARACAK